MKSYSIIAVLFAVAFYAAVMAAFLMQLWYLHKFFDGQEKKTDSTKYLSTFYYVVFILVAIAACGQVLSLLFLPRMMRLSTSEFY